MTTTLENLQAKAEHAKRMYQLGILGRQVAAYLIQPYLDAVNQASLPISKKYGRRPVLITLSKYLR